VVAIFAVRDGFPFCALGPTDKAMTRLLLALLLSLVALPSVADAAPGSMRVRLETSLGNIVVALDTVRAPQTSANFLAYVDDGRFDSTSFYRAARRKADARFGYVQGGTRTDVRRNLPPVVHEATSQTGIRHLDATISMARGGAPGTAMGNFFITVGPTPFMDATATTPGYAAFGRVVSGMEVVRRILAQPTGGGMGEMKGQMILKPVVLVRAVRLDGKPRPSGRAKPWLLWDAGAFGKNLSRR